MSFHTWGGHIPCHMMAGFDVHKDLMAAATADGRVQLFSASSGKEVRLKQIDQHGRGHDRGRCLRFSHEEGQPLKLYVSSGPTVEVWS